MPPNVWVIRAEGGQWTDHFVKSGYVGGGWLNHKDLSEIKTKSELDTLYAEAEPERSANSLGAYVGQVNIFHLEMQPDDYVITPASDSRWLYYGRLLNEPYYYSPNDSDGCWFAHRRPVLWTKNPLDRAQLPMSFLYMMRASRTAFRVSHRDQFFQKIGRPDLAEKQGSDCVPDSYSSTLKKILDDFDAFEFQDLVANLMAAIGFNDPKVSLPGPDGGVDVTGNLEVATFAKVTVVVQVKRYDLGKKISAASVKQLRQSIPFGGQGAFVTTSDYQRKAIDIAQEAGFPYIGLTNGQQLVDLLIEHKEALPEELREKLSL